MYKQDLALNNPQRLICNQTKNKNEQGQILLMIQCAILLKGRTYGLKINQAAEGLFEFYGISTFVGSKQLNFTIILYTWQ